MKKKSISEWTDGEILERIKILVKSKPFLEMTPLLNELSKRGIALFINAPKIQREG